MSYDLARIGDYLGSFARALAFWRRPAPVTTPDGLAEFVDTRCKFVAQTTLYGYLKTRAGTRYVSLFEDDVFIESINISKWEIYFACLSDMTIYAVATAGAGGTAPRDDLTALATWCYEHATRETKPEEMRPDSTALARAAFAERLESVIWPAAAAGDTAFSVSPQALVDWAPVAPELKEFDADIVANSLRYKWQNIRQELASTLEPTAVMDAWHARGEDPVTAN